MRSSQISLLVNDMMLKSDVMSKTVKTLYSFKMMKLLVIMKMHCFNYVDLISTVTYSCLGGTLGTLNIKQCWYKRFVSYNIIWLRDFISWEFQISERICKSWRGRKKHEWYPTRHTHTRIRIHTLTRTNYGFDDLLFKNCNYFKRETF